MTPWATHPIAADCRVEIARGMPALPPALDAEVEALWRQAQTDTPGLFNGGIFCADEITPHLITGHWSEYRRVVAQMRRPALRAQLKMRSLAVGGVIHGPDGVVFGRRPTRAVYQAGEWQLPPAGSVDPGCARADGTVDIFAQFRTELREELGIPPDQVRNLRPLCAVEHAPSHVCDLGIAAETSLTAAEIHALHAAGGNGEYDPLRIVPLPDLPAFLAQAGELLNLQAPVFLRLAGLLG
jgi:8-oxo-dGTP pyrophosphatase MutT (NUDIX family)